MNKVLTTDLCFILLIQDSLFMPITTKPKEQAARSPLKQINSTYVKNVEIVNIKDWDVRVCGVDSYEDDLYGCIELEDDHTKEPQTENKQPKTDNKKHKNDDVIKLKQNVDSKQLKDVKPIKLAAAMKPRLGPVPYAERNAAMNIFLENLSGRLYDSDEYVAQPPDLIRTTYVTFAGTTLSTGIMWYDKSPSIQMWPPDVYRCKDLSRCHVID